MVYIDNMRQYVGKPLTLAQKIEGRLTRKKGDVFVRADFADLGSYNNIGLVLNDFVRRGRLLRFGKGIYTRAVPSPLDGTPIPPRGIQEIAAEALKRLGVKTAPTKLERDYNAGRTTQVPGGQLIGVNRRVRRRLGYNGAYMSFERA